eukprot:jgi/Mesen1/6088/ME000031S05359
MKCRGKLASVQTGRQGRLELACLECETPGGSVSVGLAAREYVAFHNDDSGACLGSPKISKVTDRSSGSCRAESGRAVAGVHRCGGEGGAAAGAVEQAEERAGSPGKRQQQQEERREEEEAGGGGEGEGRQY